eukprot:SAG22_NODE_500_length_9715_cov_29.986793_9_plen_83_part_00
METLVYTRPAQLIQSCYDEVISPVFEKYFPTKEIPTSNIKIKLDMKLKEAKFDVVYDNVYGGLGPRTSRELSGRTIIYKPCS